MTSIVPSIEKTWIYYYNGPNEVTYTINELFASRYDKTCIKLISFVMIIEQ